MIVGVITANSAQAAQHQMANASHCSGFELRLDFWRDLDFSALKKVRDNSAVPLIFTLRNVENGGKYSGSEAERWVALRKLAEVCHDPLSANSSNAEERAGDKSVLSMDYLDIEHTVPGGFIADLKRQYPGLNILRSYHNYVETPNDLDQILDALQHPDVRVYKLATTASSSLDGLRLLNLLHRRHREQPIVGVCLGALGEFTRILAPLVGGAWVYAAIEAPSPLGLLSVQELIDIYHIDRLSKTTAIYGLIGDPVERSVGHIFHNAQFAERGLDAVYVKFNLRPEELGDFFSLIKILNIKGLSVTMPLKSSLLSFINESDQIVQTTGMINTLSFNNDGIKASNTDAPGALAAIQQHIRLQDKNVLVIGAGGAAKAIIYALFHAGCHLNVINRSSNKAATFATEFHCSVLTPHDIAGHQNDFDLVINTIPNYPEAQDFINAIVARCLSATTVVMDCVYNPQETLFITAAKKMGCPIIYGIEMFEQQAIRQLEVWGRG